MGMYSKRVWLNDDDSASTGSVVAYHGKANWDKDRDAKATFLEVSDCHCKARLHKTHGDSMESFIAKLRTLSSVANEFADFLDSDMNR
jgi:hypothetical protein